MNHNNVVEEVVNYFKSDHYYNKGDKEFIFIDKRYSLKRGGVVNIALLIS